MTTPQIQLTSITIGAPNPRELAKFYATFLRGEITADDPPREGEPLEAGWSQVKTRSSFGEITLNFEYEAQWRPLTWPSRPGEQHTTQHLDIQVDHLDSAVQWALECGATKDPHQPQETVVVMRDPAGHPFCLFLDHE